MRGERWQVTSVRAYDSCELLTLLGIEPSNAGRVQRVLTPFEDVVPIDVRSPITPVCARRWWRVCRDLIANDGSSAMLWSARTARMELLPHQLEPALAIVSGLGTRVLLADEVGLGKTVQAGLVVAELQARGALTRVLVLTPAGLCAQWAAELGNRFQLCPAVLGMQEVKKRRARLPAGVNPWSTEPLVVASIDYVKRPEVLRAVTSCPWDLVVVDEAHGAAPGTERLAAATETCGLASYVLLLTATPHSGDARAFASLCAVGRRKDKLLVFRRTRAESGEIRERRVHHLPVQPTEDEQRMHAELAAFSRIARSDRPDPDHEVWLALVTLHKRALSSATALELSVLRRLNRHSQGSEDSLEQRRLPFQDRTYELDLSDDPPALAAILENPRQERKLLERVLARARIAARFETKLAALERLLRRLSEPVVVFTEYRDTLLHARSATVRDAPIVHGGLSQAERQIAIDRFCSGRASVLFATDAAGEGLNLHEASRVVINLELPWNPMRLEQRIGRVDRIGQRRRVHAFHLIAAGTNEARLLNRLRARVRLAETLVGAPNPLAPAASSTEASLEHFALTGADRETGGRPPATHLDDTSVPPPEIEVVRLQSEAAAEHARLVCARLIAAPAVNAKATSTWQSSRSDDGPLLLRSRRRRLRSIAGAGALIVQRSVFTDSTGRVVASRLVPLSIALSDQTPFPLSNPAVKSLLRELASRSPIFDAGFTDWAEQTERLHRAFWSCRISREQAIAQAFARVRVVPIQRGLFEQAAEQRWEADRERHAAIVEGVEERLLHGSRALVLRLLDPRPALVAVR